jgi:predicted anti-sigma-YlaC factor YlaD
MRPRACDRSRSWISLRLDGELSRFEHVLLGAHLTVCRDCRHFASDVEWQTRSIREAALERLARPITIPTARSWRRPALGVSTAAIAASIVALAIGLRVPSTHGPSSPVPHARHVPAGVVRAQQTETLRDGALTTHTQAGALRGDPASS